MRAIRTPFYGWYIVALAFLSLFIGAGTAGFSFSVFLPAMTQELDSPRSALVLATSLGWLTASVVSPWVGRLIDRSGARVILTVAMAGTGAYLFATGFVNSPWEFYLTFGILGGLSRSVLQNVAPSAMIANWFVRRRTLAFSLASLAPPAASLVFAPLVAWLILTYGWRASWMVLGGISIALGVLPAALLVRRRPEDLGLRPDGDPAPDPHPPVAAAAPLAPAITAARRVADEDWTLSEVIHSRAFWMLAFGVALIQLTPQTVVVFLFSYFNDQGMSATVAATTISVLSLVQVSSRLFFWGPAIARLGGVQKVTLLWGALMLGGNLALNAGHTEVSAYLVSGVLGLAMGGNLVIQLQIWPEYFGRKAVGAITGTAQIFMGVASAGGPLLGAAVLDTTRSYPLLFGILAVCCFTGVVLLIIVGRPHRPVAVAASAGAAAG